VFDLDGVDTRRALELVDTQASLDAMASGRAAPRDAFALLSMVADEQIAHPVALVETTVLNVHDGEPAASHLVAAFDAGAHAITANKGPIACAWPRVRDAAAAAGCHLLFEGVVMDGIPVFNLARETLPALTVTCVRGIVNTTTNYLIAALEEGRPIGEALPEMQAAGIAEADPSLDVEGWDAAAKTAALGNVLMNATLTPGAVQRTGVGGLTVSDAREAIEAGCRLKLVARVAREHGTVVASVGPERLSLEDPLARVHRTMNALTISTDLLGDITIVQHGGTVNETAYALLSDLVTLHRRISPRPRARQVRNP
jgi:homoserine dehydrogenase